MDTPAHPFTCPRCGRTSHNPNDVAHQYCGHCHLFIGDLQDLQRTVALWQALRQAADDGAPPALLAWAMGQGYPYVRPLPDGRLLGLQGQIDGQALLWLGTADARTDVYTYPDLASAVHAAHTWDGTGEPTGWHHHQPSGRRRPEGDPAREYVWH